MIKLTLRNLSKSFGSQKVVDDLSLEVKEGEFVSLLGPSGCGKTTTLRMIAGFIPPTEGSIEMGGRVLSSPTSTLPPERRGMSMIFQSYAIWPNMTVAENVAFGLTLRKLKPDVVKSKVNEVLEVVRMGKLHDRYPAELSGGQQQRVALARAIVIEPEVLLLDEPLSNLDANLREEMRFEIRRLHDELKITTIYVTHDQAEAMVTSDRIVVMNQGRADQVGDPFTVYNRPETRFVAGFIGRTNFLEGEVSGKEIEFGGFGADYSLFPGLGHQGGKVLLSVRPQNIHLHRERGAGSNTWWIQGKVTERVYLGEYWDYLIAPSANGRLIRVSTSPAQVFQQGDNVWMEIDAAFVASIPSS